MSAVANGGVLWKPRLVQRIERPEKGVVWSDAGSVNGHVELSPMVWAFLRQSPVGGRQRRGHRRGRAHSRPRRRGQDRHRADRSPSRKSEKGAGSRLVRRLRAREAIRRSWWSCIVERGGQGGQVAAPIARKILNAIFLEKVASIEIAADSASVMVGIDRRLLQNVDWPLVGATVGLVIAERLHAGHACTWVGPAAAWPSGSSRGSASASWRWWSSPASTIGGSCRWRPLLYLLRPRRARRGLRARAARCRARAAGSLVGPLSVQPSELFKICFVLMAVWLLTSRWAQPVGKTALILAAPVALIPVGADRQAARPRHRAPAVPRADRPAGRGRAAAAAPGRARPRRGRRAAPGVVRR